MIIKEKKPISFMSFWSINDKLDLEELKRQMDEMKEAGLDGVVFHPRYYPNLPTYLGEEYMNIVSKLILYAKTKKMEFWIYDENGWPSGTAGGKVMQLYSELRSQCISIVKEGEINSPLEGYMHSFRIHNGEILNAHSTEGELYHICKHTWEAPSSIESEACYAFIATTHDAYKNCLEPEAFDYITGFFSDEVHFPMGQIGFIPWTNQLQERYMERYGEEFLPQLPCLFMPVGDYQKVRIRFWELVTDQIIEGFYKPLAQWGRKNNKLVSGHLKGEETPAFQLPFSGSCFQVFRNMLLPGIDSLERDAGNNFFPSIVSSIAKQFGTGDCLAEAFGGSGWGIKPDDMIKYFTWLMKHGINRFVIHINHLRLKSSAVRDWPPSLPSHITWKKAFPAVIGKLHETAENYYKIKKDADLLVVTPTRGVMAEYEPWELAVTNVHNGKNPPDTAATRISEGFIQLIEELNLRGINYELTEERIIEEGGMIEKGSLVIGRQRYPYVIIPQSCCFTDKGIHLINQLKSSGVQVWNEEEWKRHSFCSKSSEQSDLNIIKKEIYTPLQTKWKVTMPEYNLFALQVYRDKEGKLYSAFTHNSVDKIELVLLDFVQSVLINGETIEGFYNEGKYIFDIPTHILKRSDGKKINIEYICPSEKNPIIFLKGSFLVKSLSTYEKSGKNGVFTKGPFILVKEGTLENHDLIVSGLPFCPMPVTVEKQVDFSHYYGNKMKLSHIEAVAARVKIDKIDLGWCWSPEWTVEIPDSLKQGIHNVSVELIPNTFNVYGPHHHIDGDIHLVSPEQYEGVKNFADRFDAPEKTSVDHWNFIRFGITGDVLIT